MTDKEKRYSIIEDNVNEMCHKVAEYINTAFHDDEEAYKSIMLNTACSFLFASIISNNDKIEYSDAFDSITYVVNSIFDYIEEFNSGELDEFIELGGDDNDSSTTN